MPKDKIDTAIKKGTGEFEGSITSRCGTRVTASAGAAIMVDCLTDNKTRTVADVRHAFNKYGGNMAPTAASPSSSSIAARCCLRPAPTKAR